VAGRSKGELMVYGVELAPLVLTLKVASLATLLSLCAGVALAYIMCRRGFPGAGAVDALLTLPLVLPPTVLGYYLIVLLGRKGALGGWLMNTFGVSLIFSWQGAVVAAAVVAFPLVFRSARAAFQGVDPNLEDAARVLGEDEGPVFIRVSLPLAWRGILAGAMLTFARAMGEFGATLMVAGNIPGRTQTLSMAVYEAVQAGNYGTGNALVLITSVACFVILMVSGRLLKAGF